VRIVFDGAFGIDSAGDDAPLAFMVHELRKRLDRPHFTALVRHPDWRLADRLGVETVANLEHESKAASAGRWYRGLNFGDSRAELQSIADVVANADLLILGAGNFLTEVGIDVLRGHLPRFVAMCLAAEMARTPMMLFGLSANRLRHPWTIRAADWLLRSASALTFREPIAIENLRASGVAVPDYVLLPDPALGAPSAPSGTGRAILASERIPITAGKRLALAPRDLSWMGREISDRYEREQVALVDLWCANRENDVIFVPQCTYCVDDPRTDDRHLASRLRAASRHPERVHVVQGRYDYDEVESIYGEAHAVVATRLHGAVFAARMGIPVIGLAYEDKVRGFFDQMRLAEVCLPWDAEAAAILERLLAVSHPAGRMSSLLRANVARLQGELHGYVEIAERLVAGSPDARRSKRRDEPGRSLQPPIPPA
jgi:colanic acid/amylovoran biosynthesis protein